MVLLKDLSPAIVEEHLHGLVAIGNDVGGERWGASQFLLELPAKWSLSFAAWQGPDLVAYAIASLKKEGVHLHRLMVARGHRSQGLGSRMLRELTARSEQRGTKRVTLKVAKNNESARCFYEGHGFQVEGEDGIDLKMFRLIDRSPARSTSRERR